jgi:hypothetical protein
VTPVVRGKTVAFVRVRTDGVPRFGVMSVGDVASATVLPEPVVVAAAIAVPFPESTGAFIGVVRVIAGVEVALATVPAKPLVETTDTVVTVPPPAGVAHVPSPRQKVVEEALVPLFRFVTGKLPVTPVVRGSPVAFVSVTDVGVPRTGVVRVGDVSVLFVRVCAVVLSTVTEVSIAIEFPVMVMPFP